MGLVKIEDYKESEISKLVTSSLLEVGLLAVARAYGYTISISGVHEPTPSGMIEDSPDEHLVTIERSCYIGPGNRYSFVHKDGTIDNDDKAAQEIIDDKSKDNYKFKLVFGEFNNVFSGIHLVKPNYLWYEHRLTLKIKRQENESNEDYALRIVEALYKIFTRQ